MFIFQFVYIPLPGRSIFTVGLRKRECTDHDHDTLALESGIPFVNGQKILCYSFRFVISTMENLGLGHGHSQKGHSAIKFCGKILILNFTILITENFDFAHDHGHDHSIIANAIYYLETLIIAQWSPYTPPDVEKW